MYCLAWSSTLTVRTNITSVRDNSTCKFYSILFCVCAYSYCTAHLYGFHEYALNKNRCYYVMLL